MSDTATRIRGNMPALVTPLTPDLKVDTEGIARLVDHVLEGGVHGVVVLGTSGEFQSIDTDQRGIAISTAVEACGGRVPVLAGAGLPNLKATIEQIKAAEDAGADGCLVTPPYYFPIDQDAIVAWFERLVAATSLPILYYHFPRMTKLMAEPDTVVRMREAGLAGIKDSGGLTTYLQQVLLRLADDPGFRVMVGGDNHFLAALVHGADGTIGLPPNVVPEIGSRLFEAYASGDMETASEMQRRAVEFVNALMPGGGNGQSVAKAALEKLGICGRTVAPPMRTLSESEAEEVWRRVRDIVRKPVEVA